MEYERRMHPREPNPPCGRCHATAVAVALRTSHVLYFRCAECGEVWSMPKPGTEHPAIDVARRFS